MSQIKLGSGPFYYSDVEDNSGQRAARWYYFSVLCKHKPELLSSLVNDVRPVFALLCDRIAPYLHVRDRGDSVELTGSDIIVGLSERFDAHALTFLNALVQWGRSNDLKKCGHWTLDIAVTILRSWHYNPPLERPCLPEIKDYAVVFIGDLLNVPMFNFATLKREDITDEWIEAGEQNGSEPQSAEDCLRAINESDRRKKAQLERASYDPSIESRSKAKERLLKSLDRELDQYLDEVEDFYLDSGFKRTVVKRERKGSADMHFEWLYYRHMRGLGVEEVTEQYQKMGIELSTAIVSRETRALSTLIGVKLT